MQTLRIPADQLGIGCSPWEEVVEIQVEVINCVETSASKLSWLGCIRLPSLGTRDPHQQGWKLKNRADCLSQRSSCIRNTRFPVVFPTYHITNSFFNWYSFLWDKTQGQVSTRLMGLQSEFEAKSPDQWLQRGPMKQTPISPCVIGSP